MFYNIVILEQREGIHNVQAALIITIYRSSRNLPDCVQATPQIIFAATTAH
jgi:hypothetical protein